MHHPSIKLIPALAHREMKLLLPGGGGAGGIIRGWGLRGQGAKILFCCQGEVVQEALSGGGGEKGEKGAGCKTTFPI